ncbi:MAG: hypothetical protein JSU59_01875 [Nitrospirota bacterium]|nr:MAG: hypothetical protein JSU59_01875 [Nitrospirota bacterium]
MQGWGKKDMVLGELETRDLKLETFPVHSKVIEDQFQEKIRKIILGKREKGSMAQKSEVKSPINGKFEIRRTI